MLGNKFSFINGESKLALKLRQTSKYKIWRELVFLRDNFICQNLNCVYCKNKQGVMLNPHHIKSFVKYPESRFDINNGITYCKEFHINSKLHKRNNVIGEKYVV